MKIAALPYIRQHGYLNRSVVFRPRLTTGLALSYFVTSDIPVLNYVKTSIEMWY